MLTLEAITIVEVAVQQVLVIKKTGTYQLIPELLRKIYEFIVEKNGARIFLCRETTPKL
jgi:hypothetical protein